MDYGVGRHVYYLGHEHSIKAMRFDWLAQSFLIPGVTTGKISFAFFILRLSNTKWHTFFLQTVNATLIIIDIPLIILTFAQCKPAALLWDPSLHGYCWDPTQVGALALFQGCKLAHLQLQTKLIARSLRSGDFPDLCPLSPVDIVEPSSTPQAQVRIGKPHVLGCLVSSFVIASASVPLISIQLRFCRFGQDLFFAEAELSSRLYL